MNNPKQETRGMGSVEELRKLGIEMKVKYEEPEPYLNRKERRKHGLKGVNVPKTQADELKEIAVMKVIKNERS